MQWVETILDKTIEGVKIFLKKWSSNDFILNIFVKKI